MGPQERLRRGAQRASPSTRILGGPPFRLADSPSSEIARRSSAEHEAVGRVQVLLLALNLEQVSGPLGHDRMATSACAGDPRLAPVPPESAPPKAISSLRFEGRRRGQHIRTKLCERLPGAHGRARDADPPNSSPPEQSDGVRGAKQLPGASSPTRCDSSSPRSWPARTSSRRCYFAATTRCSSSNSSSTTPERCRSTCRHTTDRSRSGSTPRPGQPLPGDVASPSVQCNDARHVAFRQGVTSRQPAHRSAPRRGAPGPRPRPAPSRGRRDDGLHPRPERSARPPRTSARPRRPEDRRPAPSR